MTLLAFLMDDNQNPWSTKLKNLNFHPLEVVPRYREPQLPVGENYANLYNLNHDICQSIFFNAHFSIKCNFFMLKQKG